MENPKLFKNTKGQAGVEKLYPFVVLIVLVGMIIGVGVLISDKFGSATSNIVYNINQTFSEGTWVNNSVVDLSGGNITAVHRVTNHTGSGNIAPGACYFVNKTPGTIMFVNSSVPCDMLPSISIIYDWKNYDTITRRTMSSVTDEIGAIATDWLGLIVTVMILSIILFLVVRSFSPGMSRE